MKLSLVVVVLTGCKLGPWHKRRWCFRSGHDNASPATSQYFSFLHVHL